MLVVVHTEYKYSVRSIHPIILVNFSTSNSSNCERNKKWRLIRVGQTLVMTQDFPIRRQLSTGDVHGRRSGIGGTGVDSVEGRGTRGD